MFLRVDYVDNVISLRFPTPTMVVGALLGAADNLSGAHVDAVRRLERLAPSIIAPMVSGRGVRLCEQRLGKRINGVAREYGISVSSYLRGCSQAGIKEIVVGDPQFVFESPVFFLDFGGCLPPETVGLIAECAELVFCVGRSSDVCVMSVVDVLDVDDGAPYCVIEPDWDVSPTSGDVCVVDVPCAGYVDGLLERFAACHNGFLRHLCERVCYVGRDFGVPVHDGGDVDIVTYAVSGVPDDSIADTAGTVGSGDIADSGDTGDTVGTVGSGEQGGLTPASLFGVGHEGTKTMVEFMWQALNGTKTGLYPHLTPHGNVWAITVATQGDVTPPEITGVLHKIDGRVLEYTRTLHAKTVCLDGCPTWEVIIPSYHNPTKTMRRIRRQLANQIGAHNANKVDIILTPIGESGLSHATICLPCAHKGVLVLFGRLCVPVA